MPETSPETCASAKDSPFFIKNLLNCDSKASRPKPALSVAKAALDGGFSLAQVGDFGFPRFDLPAHRFSLPAHYLERTSAWWYPYALSSSSHIQRTEGETRTRNASVPLRSTRGKRQFSFPDHNTPGLAPGPSITVATSYRSPLHWLN